MTTTRSLTIDQKRSRLVHFALRHLGKPYRYAAPSSQAPQVFDCSSFTQYLYRRIGIELPRTSIEQAALGRIISPVRQQLEVGDLLFFRGSQGRYDRQFPEGIGHVGMYLGDDKIVHTKYAKCRDGSDGGAVRTDPLDRIARRYTLITVKRLRM